MSRIREVAEVRRARLQRVDAKVQVLRGGECAEPGFQGKRLLLEGMRVYLASMVGYPRLVAVPAGDGFALYLQISHGPRVWLIAERSKRVRIIKRVDTVLAVVRDLGADQVIVRTAPDAPVSHANADGSVRPGQLQEHV